MFRLLIALFIIISSGHVMAKDRSPIASTGRIHGLGCIDTGDGKCSAALDKAKKAPDEEFVPLTTNNACLEIIRDKAWGPREWQRKMTPWDDIKNSMQLFVTVLDEPGECAKSTNPPYRYIVIVTITSQYADTKEAALESVEIREWTSATTIRVRRAVPSTLLSTLSSNLRDTFVRALMTPPSPEVTMPMLTKSDKAPGDLVAHVQRGTRHFHDYKDHRGEHYVCPLYVNFRENECSEDGHSDERCVIYSECLRVSALDDGTLIF